jgi:broad specificity phosphatase PhoE
MNYLILVRHSAPEIVPEVSARDWHLSAVGRARCVPLAAALAPYQPRAIITSVEPKAVETGQITAERLGVPQAAMDGLHEHDRRNVGLLDPATFQVRVAAFFAQPDTLVLGHETAAQAGDRFTRAIDAVLAAYPDDTVAVVAHGAVLSLYLAQVAGIDPYPFWQRLGLPAFMVLARPTLAVLTVRNHLE